MIQKNNPSWEKTDATRLGIVKLYVDGASDEIVQHLSDSTDETYQKVSGGQTQQEIDANMDKIVQEFSSVFSHSTGKIAGDPIKIHVKSDTKPVVQLPRRIPLHYVPDSKKKYLLC